jgi:uncharacterized protein
MNDQTNPRLAAARAGAGRAARAEGANDRTNPKPTAPRAGRGQAAHTKAAKDQTNPKPMSRSGERRAARAEGANDRTNPKPAARRAAAEQAGLAKATKGQTNPKPTARRVAAGQMGLAEATKRQTNPKPAARRAAAGQAGPAKAAKGQTSPKPAAPREKAAHAKAATDQTNPNAAATARLRYDDAYIKGILQRVRTIAAVGMSANDMRPSYFAMLYLQQKGYRMIPVNPRYAGRKILGETVVASLADLPAPPDMVQIFRKAEEAAAAVDQAIEAGARVIWLQLGIRSEEAAAKARAAGLDVVMDRCPKIEYGRLFGEIGWAGVNRRVISAKKGQAVQLSRNKGGLLRRPAPRG